MNQAFAATSVASAHTPAGAAASKVHGYTLSEIEDLKPDLGVTQALSEALPVPDLMFGGAVLLLIVMFHAFWIRLIANGFRKRLESSRFRLSAWYADLLFALTVNSLLVLHLAEILIWSAALILSGIIGDWSKAAYFAANAYTALGEPFSLPHAWRILAPIMAISGIFSFAWTASVLVNLVDRYNQLRDERLAQGRAQTPAKKRTR